VSGDTEVAVLCVCVLLDCVVFLFGYTYVMPVCVVSVESPVGAAVDSTFGTGTGCVQRTCWLVALDSAGCMGTACVKCVLCLLDCFVGNVDVYVSPTSSAASRSWADMAACVSICFCSVCVTVDVRE
jgi:hypothetical protein